MTGISSPGNWTKRWSPISAAANSSRWTEKDLGEWREKQSGAASGARAAASGSCPFARLQNPFRPVEILSADQIEAIHRASLRLLENVGFEVLHDESLEIFKQAGAKVDFGTKRVQLDGALVEALIAKAPPASPMRARNRERDVTVGEGESDLHRHRRAGLRQRSAIAAAAPAITPTCAISSSWCSR